MKKLLMITVVLTLVLVGASSGADSPKGGSVGKGEGFKIDVPTFDVKVKQGETQSINIKLQRDESFKQDVKLEIKAADGISVDPAKILIKASDKPEVKLTIVVPKDAALGEYLVTVTGTPKTGEPTSVEFNVKVIAAEAGHTVQSDSPKGGSTVKGEGFKIVAPAFDTKVKQGEVQNVTISIERGESFTQDVTLELKLTKGEGLTLEPTKVVVKADDEPNVQITITASKDAAIGEHIITVTGTPTTGEPTTMEFNVKVIAIEAGSTVQSAEPMRKCTAGDMNKSMAGCMKTCQANMEDVSAAKAAIRAAIEAIDKGDTKTAKIELEKADKLLSNVHKCMKENMQQMPCSNAKCPIMEKSIERMDCPNELTRMYKGMKVGFCSAGCPATWDKLTDSEKDAKLKDAMPSKE